MPGRGQGQGSMDKFLKTADKEWYRRRLTGSMFCLMAAFILLASRLFYLQILEGEEFRRLSENQCIRLQSMDSPRGLIFDRNRALLADNRPSFDLNIVLKDAGDVGQTIEKLAGYINVPQEYLMSKIRNRKQRPSYKPILLKQDIDRDMLARIEVHKFDLPGIVVNIRQKRHYLHKQSVAHLTGYLGEINSRELKKRKLLGYRSGDEIGKFGAEKAFESSLKGKRGGRQVEVNAKGQVVKVLRTVPAEPGRNICLTIDRVLQEKAESLMEGVAGAVVAMDPVSGHVLAMASNPSFDPNAFVNGISHKDWNALLNHPFKPMCNRVIQGEYPPGSTYKIVTAIAGLEERVVTPRTTFYCPGYYEYGDRTFKCWKKTGHGSCNMVSALAQSCDVYFYQVGQKLGVDRLAKYAKACGLGKRTGIELDHEGDGLVPTSAWKKQRTGIAWQRGETLSVAIGQGANLATPLQMAVMIAAVGNGGVLPTPRVLKIAEGETVHENATSEPGEAYRLPASKKTLGIVKKGLWEVVNGSRGTARVAHVNGIDIIGKTGTSQVVGHKSDAAASRKRDRSMQIKPHAWFVAYAESDGRQIAISVVVEHGEHGSGTASPIAREVIKCCFR